MDSEKSRKEARILVQLVVIASMMIIQPFVIYPFQMLENFKYLSIAYGVVFNLNIVMNALTYLLLNRDVRKSLGLHRNPVKVGTQRKDYAAKTYGLKNLSKKTTRSSPI